MKIEGKEVTQVRVNIGNNTTYLRPDLHTLMYTSTFVAVAVIRFQVWHHSQESYLFFSSTIRSLPRHGFPGPLSGAI